MERIKLNNDTHNCSRSVLIKTLDLLVRHRSVSVTPVNNCHFPVKHHTTFHLFNTLQPYINIITTLTKNINTNTSHTHTLISPIITVSKIDISSGLITTYLTLSKIIFYLTTFLVPCIVVISIYLAIVTINEVIRNRRVIYASPPVQ